jgi:hypothetical protein
MALKDWARDSPQVWSTAVTPIPALRCLGSAAIVSIVGHGLEQQIRNPGPVLISDIGDRSRQREHDVEVGHRQQLGLASGEPLFGSGARALGAVPVGSASACDGEVVCDVARRTTRNDPQKPGR